MYTEKPKIGFRDRPLKKGERHHHYCKDCGAELNSDIAYKHKCTGLKFKERAILKSVLFENRELFSELSKK